MLHEYDRTFLSGGWQKVRMVQETYDHRGLKGNPRSAH